MVWWLGDVIRDLRTLSVSTIFVFQTIAFLKASQGLLEHQASCLYTTVSKGRMCVWQRGQGNERELFKEKNIFPEAPGRLFSLLMGEN